MVNNGDLSVTFGNIIEQKYKEFQDESLPAMKAHMSSKDAKMYDEVSTKADVLYHILEDALPENLKGIVDIFDATRSTGLGIDVEYSFKQGFLMGLEYILNCKEEVAVSC